jgi:protease-4
MKQFIKLVLATMVGFFLSALALVIVSFLLIAGIIAAAGADKVVAVSENSILHIRLDHPITERTSKNPLDELNLPGISVSRNIGLNDILASIAKAKTDDHIKGIYLDLSGTQTGQATASEIRGALLDFKKSGKFIIAYSEVYSKLDYYLVSVADKVYLNPQGYLEFSGFHSEVTFFKGALDKLGIEAQVIKVGTYKSAVEPYVMDHMSDANRLQVSSFLGSIYDHYLSGIAGSRKIPKDTLFSIANELRVQQPQDAFALHLVDGLKYKDEVISELKKRTKTADGKTLASVSLEDYANSVNKVTGSSNTRIALIYASGEITGGEGGNDVVGSGLLSRDIRRVRLDDKVKAVVFRINSPGGSALASDVIWREVMLTRKVKPVVVSMGDVAASGGYYIACAADSIFAQPNTITGSIGVFGILPNMQNFFNDKLGITFDGVKTGNYADLGDMARPLSPAERVIIQNQVNKVYDDFTGRVASGRKKTKEYINSIGQGRVWSGSQALSNGLVDRLGTLNDAIHSAAKMARLKDYRLVSYPAIKDPIQSLFESSGDKLKDYFTRQELGESYTYYEQLRSITRLRGIQSRLPYQLTIN